MNSSRGTNQRYASIREVLRIREGLRNDSTSVTKIRSDSRRITKIFLFEKCYESVDGAVGDSGGEGLLAEMGLEGRYPCSEVPLFLTSEVPLQRGKSLWWYTSKTC